MKLSKYIKNINIGSLVFPSLLIFVSIFLSYRNFVPGTWLSGWDNLHPEFNLMLNIKRSIYASWQEYQGLGLLGGMAHAADLPRQILLLIASIFIKQQYLRYFWTFLMLLLGPLGVYNLISKEFIKDERKFPRALAGLVGGVFYLNNLATVQYFYTPYESFVSFYGFLPWLLYYSLRFLREGSKKALILLILFSILGTSSFYVQTLFLVLLIILAVPVIESIARNRLVGIKRSIILGITIFTVNAFWLLPSLYFSFGNSKVLTQSKVNSFSTPEIELFNKSNGNLSDVSMLKGFWFDYTDVTPDGKFEYLMPSWREHIDKKSVRNLSYGMFAVSFLGILISLFVKNIKFRFSTALLFVISALMLLGTNPPLGFVYSFITEKISFFGIAFRSVFTKWSIPAALFYSLGLSFGVYLLTLVLKGKKIIIATFLGITVCFITFRVVQPAYKGDLIYSRLRISIPDEYFELFRFFDKEPGEARIAFFPIHTFWGWNFYDWNYRGSGFLWYGIKQPIIDRAFDVWSNYDEGFYHEASSALYGNDEKGFADTLRKYDVTYVLIDENVIFYNVPESYLRYKETKDFLSQEGELVFEKGNLLVYRLDDIGFVKGLDSKGSEVNLGRVRKDIVFSELGNYYEDDSGYYPFSYLAEEEEIKTNYSETNNGVWLGLGGKQSSSGDENYKITIPSLDHGDEIVFPATLSLSERDLKVIFKSNFNINGISGKTLPGLLLITPRILSATKVSINGSVFDISQGENRDIALKLKVGDPISIYAFDANKKKTFVYEENFFEKTINECWKRDGYDGVLNVSKNQEGYMSIETKDAAGCFALKVGKMESVNYALFDVQFPFRSHFGSKPSFCIVAEGPVYKCLNDDIFYNEVPSDDWNIVRRQLVLESGNTYWIEVVAKPPDIAGDGWTIDYKEPVVDAYPMASFFTFDQSVWEELLNNYEIEVETDQNLDLEVFSLPTEANFRQGGLVNVKNCDVLKRGEIGRDIISGRVYYSSEDRGANCDYVPLNTLSTKNGYLARFMGEGLIGRGLKFYLYNKATERNDLEVLLGLGNYDKTYSVLPWDYLDKDSYVLNIEQRSFGESASDKIDKILFYLLPTDWLAHIYISQFEVPVNLKGAEIESYEITGTHRYDVNLKTDSVDRLVYLSQAYDKGWKGYLISGDDSVVLKRIKEKLPFVFAKKLEHKIVNSWANAWVVPLQNEFNDVGQKVILVFIPQYLQYLGFVLFAIYLIFVVGFIVKKNNLNYRKLL